MPAFEASTCSVMRLFNRVFAGALWVLPLLAASVAFAADTTTTKNESSFGTAKGTGPFLTKDQLRKCIAQQDSLKTQDADLVKEQAAITAQKAEILRVGDELKTKLDAIDRTSAEAVAGYNEAVQARDKQIDEYQTRVTKFNAGVDDNQAAHEQFGQGCSGRRYFEDDETAIRKGK